MSEQTRPIAVDLFSGAGGMTLGLEQAGFDILASVEIDPIHCAVHKFNFPQWVVICDDISRITAASIRLRSPISNQKITLVAGGSPCQGFSLIGKRSLDDPRNQLVFHFIRLTAELDADYFIFENVKGLTIGNHKQFLLEIIETFETKGYKVQPYKILNALHYGVPQNRERLFLLGCKKHLTLPQYPPRHQKFPTVLAAIRDLPEATLFPELFSQDWAIAEFTEETNYSSFLRGSAIASDDYSYPRIGYNRKNKLTSSKLTLHSDQTVSRFNDTLQGSVEPISRFLRLNPSSYCCTLRAGTPEDRGSHTASRPIHPFYPRCITNREAARLHSYPDWFRAHSTKWHGFRQIGNSVPPLLAKSVAQEIIKVVGIQPIKPTNLIKLGCNSLLKLSFYQAIAQIN